MNGITRELVENNLMFIIRWTFGVRDKVSFIDMMNTEVGEDDCVYIKDIYIACREQQPEVILPFFDAYILDSGDVEEFMFANGIIDSPIYTKAREEKEAQKLAKAKAHEIAKAEAKAIRENPLANTGLANCLKGLGF